MKYAAITENDISQYSDQTGVLYHFPKRYKKLLEPGTLVVYYKGKMEDQRFENARLSKVQHYFGTAKIGKVTVDPNDPSQFFATIEDFIQFDEAIFFKDEKGQYLEEHSNSQAFRNGVRELTKENYLNVLSSGSYSNTSTSSSNSKTISFTDGSIPKLDDVNISEGKGLLVSTKSNKSSNPSSSKNNNLPRYSRNAKKVGDRAEELVCRYLEDVGYINVVWEAKLGNKPGYDISCETSTGMKLHIEVKGTVSNKITNFILTDGELKAAMILKENYYMAFVVNCLSVNAQVELVANPNELMNDNSWNSKPLTYLISF